MQEKEKEEVQREQLRKDVQEINDRGRRAERAAGNAAKHLYRIVAVALLGALVFVSSMLSVPIPVAIGDITRIHLGNIFCLLSGFLLGPVGGGNRLCPLRFDKSGLYCLGTLYLCFQVYAGVCVRAGGLCGE